MQGRTSRIYRNESRKRKCLQQRIDYFGQTTRKLLDFLGSLREGKKYHGDAKHPRRRYQIRQRSRVLDPDH